MERPLLVALLTAPLSYFLKKVPCFHFLLSPTDYGAALAAFLVENLLVPGTFCSHYYPTWCWAWDADKSQLWKVEIPLKIYHLIIKMLLAWKAKLFQTAPSRFIEELDAGYRPRGTHTSEVCTLSGRGKIESRGKACAVLLTSCLWRDPPADLRWFPTDDRIVETWLMEFSTAT